MAPNVTRLGMVAVLVLSGAVLQAQRQAAPDRPAGKAQALRFTFQPPSERDGAPTPFVFEPQTSDPLTSWLDRKGPPPVFAKPGEVGPVARAAAPADCAMVRPVDPDDPSVIRVVTPPDPTRFPMRVVPVPPCGR